MPTSKNITNLVINKVESQEVYDSMKANGLVNEDELYVVLGEDKIDASSITDLDTYLSDSYIVKSVSGSYVGYKSSNSTNDQFTSIDAIKTGGRKIQFPFTPVKITFNDKPAGSNIVGQGNFGAIKASLTDGSGNFTGYYYFAYLEDSTLYVAHHKWTASADGDLYADSFNTSGFTYNWTALVVL